MNAQSVKRQSNRPLTQRLARTAMQIQWHGRQTSRQPAQTHRGPVDTNHHRLFAKRAGSNKQPSACHLAGPRIGAGEHSEVNAGHVDWLLPMRNPIASWQSDRIGHGPDPLISARVDTRQTKLVRQSGDNFRKRCPSIHTITCCPHPLNSTHGAVIPLRRS